MSDKNFNYGTVTEYEPTAFKISAFKSPLWLQLDTENAREVTQTWPGRDLWPNLACWLQTGKQRNKNCTVAETSDKPALPTTCEQQGLAKIRRHQDSRS